MTEKISWPGKFVIGRATAHGLAEAFTIERQDGGGVKLTGIDPSVTDAERQAVLVTFGEPQSGRYPMYDKGKLGTGFGTTEPGTPQHFVQAVYALPRPFYPMRQEG